MTVVMSLPQPAADRRGLAPDALWVAAFVVLMVTPVRFRRRCCTGRSAGQLARRRQGWAGVKPLMQHAASDWWW
jgi:hypothetical protein